jgi:hypothetical protein
MAMGRGQGSREQKMIGSGHLMSGADVATGTFVLMVFAAGAAMAALTVAAVFMIRRAGPSGLIGALWGGGLVLAAATLTFLLFDYSPARDPGAERRAVEARASELTAQAIAPGSALACLDAVSNAAVESACEKALFATPEAVASAVAFIDARLSLLASSVALAGHDASYRTAVDRLRRGIEQDRFGFVAHVLATRGCTSPSCGDLALLRDASRVLANMKTQAFEAYVGSHAVAWNPGGAGVVSAMSSPTVQPSSTTGLSQAVPPAPSAVAGSSGGRYDFPSASSIPPVSIMNPEPETPPAAEPKAAAAPAKKPPSRRQTVREPAPAAAPPTTIVPQTTPQAQTSGSR